jgi:predicted nucleic acid-binding Zn ribbon protein
VSSPEGPRPVGDALRAVRRQLGTPAPSVFERVRADWPELVGAALGTHSTPLHLRAGVLRVGVDDPAWAGQFQYLADPLVAALADRVPEAAIREISVTVTRGSDRASGDGADQGDEWSDGHPGPT